MTLLFTGTDQDDIVKESSWNNISPGDQLQGGAGNDQFTLVSSKVFVDAGPGQDTIDASAANGGGNLLYNFSPAGIVFDHAAGTVQDGWGSTDRIVGEAWWVFGSEFADSIQLDAGQVYALGGDDTIIGNGLTIRAGQGHDTISGSKLVLLNDDSPAAVRGNLAEGWLEDGWGSKDRISGMVRITLPVAGSELVGADGDETFEITTGSHTIDGAAGQDKVLVQQSFLDFSVVVSGDWTTFTHKVNGEQIRLARVEQIQFSDKTLDLQEPIGQQALYATQADLTLDVQSIYNQFPSGSSITLTNLVVADLDADLKPEIVAHYWRGQQVMGTATNEAVVNRLAIFSTAGPALKDVTSQWLATDQAPELSGATRQNRTADLNGDGFADIAWSMNKEDGRDGDSDNSAQTNILLSDASSGRYRIVGAGPQNWFHGVAAAPAVGDYPGLVVASGFRREPSGLTVGPAGLTTADLPVIGSGTLLHLDWLDDLQTGARYFIGDIALGKIGTLRWLPDSGWSINASFDDHRADTYKEVGWISWQQSLGTIKLFEYKSYLALGGGITEAAIWHPAPGQDPLVLTKFATAVTTDASQTLVRENDVLPGQFLEFYKVTSSGIEAASVNVTDEQFIVNSNFVEVLDFNQDGYEDVLVYTYQSGGQPIVYLNDTLNGLYKAGMTNLLPSAPLSFSSSATAKVLDANADGLWDLLFWPSGYSAAYSSDTTGLALFLGQDRPGTGPDFSNPAQQGAAGFNEVYYLKAHPEVASKVQSGLFANGLAHYLAEGKAQGLSAFAQDTWIHGHEGADLIMLREGAEKAFGYAGHDILSGLSGNDTLDGGSGSDTAVWSGHVSRYTLSRSGDHWLVQDTTGQDGTDTLLGVEKLQFSDKTVIIESAPLARSGAIPDELYQFFISAFHAAPGSTYMSQLLEAHRYGLSISEIVEIFTRKEQFTDLYPPSDPPQDLATRLVNNIVKTSATEPVKARAVKDILEAMDSGWTMADVIYRVFGNLATKPLTDIEWGNTARQFANEIAVAKCYTETWEQGTTDLSTLRSVLAPITSGSDVSTEAAIVSLVGQALMAG